MKGRQLKTILTITLFVFVLFSLTGFNAYASGNPIEVIIPVIQDFYIQSNSTHLSEPVGKYELYSGDSDSPMPKGSKNGRFEFSIVGSNTSTEINFLSSRAGVYNYTLKQITEDAEQYTYDRTVYAITLYIENTPDGQFSSQIVVENGDGGKCAEIRFENYYKNDSGSAQFPATGDSSNILFWGLLCFFSFVGVIVLAITRRKITQ